MITQRELETIARWKRDLATLENDPTVNRYLGCKKSLETALAGLRQRVAAGDEAAPGKWALSVKRSFSVSWEKALNLLTGCDEISRALLKSEAGRAVIRQAQTKDPAAAFVSERLQVEVVACC